MLNIGNDTLRVRMWTTPIQFKIQSPEIIRKLGPGNEISENINFKPTSLGQKSGKLYFDHNTDNKIRLDSISLTANVITRVASGSEIPKVFSIN